MPLFSLKACSTQSSCINTLDRIQAAPSKNRNSVSYKYTDYWINKSKDRPQLNKSLECARNKARIGPFVGENRKPVVSSMWPEGPAAAEHAFAQHVKPREH